MKKKILTTSLALALGLTLVVPTAKADELDDLLNGATEIEGDLDQNTEDLNKLNKKEEVLEDNKEINTTNPTPSEEDVKEYWHNYESKGENKENYNGIELTNQYEDIYEVKPNLKTKEKGSLKQSIIDDTIHVLNTFRYSMGLDLVEEDKNLSEKAQAGAFINYANGGISHYPKTPENFTDEDQVVKDGKLANSESNLCEGCNIYDAVGEYMGDDDPINNQMVGHRKWLMNPFLKRVGIGQVGGFNNIYVADDSAFSFNNDKIVTYPTKVNFTEFINPFTPFSVNLGIDYNVENIDNVKVVVTDKNGNVKTYTKDNGLFYSNSSHGNSTALVFGNELSKEKGSEYKIKVLNLKANGKELPIEYISKFISVNDKKKVVIPAKEIEDIAKPIEKPSIPWTEIEDNAEIIEEEKPSIPWTEIEDNAEIIEDNKDDGKEDSPSKDKEDDKSIPWTKIEDNAEIIEEEKPSEKIIIPAVKIEDIAKSIEKDKTSDNKKEDSPSKDIKDNKDQNDQKESSKYNKEKEINDRKVENVKPIANAQTGVTGIGAVLTTLSAASIILFKSKRK